MQSLNTVTVMLEFCHADQWWQIYWTAIQHAAASRKATATQLCFSGDPTSPIFCNGWTISASCAVLAFVSQLLIKVKNYTCDGSACTNSLNSLNEQTLIVLSMQYYWWLVIVVRCNVLSYWYDHNVRRTWRYITNFLSWHATVIKSTLQIIDYIYNGVSSTRRLCAVSDKWICPGSRKLRMWYFHMSSNHEKYMGLMRHDHA